MTKARKGTPTVFEQSGWLRIRFTHNSKLYKFSLGIPSSKASWRQAEGIAQRIANDIAAEVFDKSLQRYKPYSKEPSYNHDRLTAVALFREFVDHKAKHVTPKTIEKYRATENYLERFFGAKPVEFIGMTDAEKFVEWMGQQQHPLTKRPISNVQVKRRIEELEAAWKWHIEEFNPWNKIHIKLPPRQPPQPFTQNEVTAILKIFRESRYYNHYYYFVLCSLLLGTRTGETIGLRYRHFPEDMSSVWIGEIITRGVDRPAKKYKDRSFALTPQLQKILRDRKPVEATGNSLVFSSPTGLAIDDHNFSQRIWKPLLEKAGVPVRKFYFTRATYISHALASGANPSDIAAITGHDLQSLYTRYAAYIKTQPQLMQVMNIEV